MTEQSKETKLKPCPLCGPSPNKDLPDISPVQSLVEPRKSSFEQYEPSRMGEAAIQCGWCGLKILRQSGDLAALEKSAINLRERWNTRTPDTAQLLKDKEELERALSKLQKAAEVMSYKGTRPGGHFVMLGIAWMEAKHLLARLSPSKQEDKSLYDMVEAALPHDFDGLLHQSHGTITIEMGSYTPTDWQGVNTSPEQQE